MGYGAMQQHSNSALEEFRKVARDVRRKRADVDATLERLAELRAETDKIIADSKVRIARSLAALERCPSIAPEAHSASEVGPDQRQAPVFVIELLRS